MNSMKAKHNWFVIGIGKGPINKTRKANNVQTTADSGEHASEGAFMQMGLYQ